MLVTFALIAIIVALLIPQYIKLNRASNVQIATQQADAVRKAVLEWSGSFSDLGSLNTAYGNNNNISLAAFNTVRNTYLDQSFAPDVQGLPFGADPVQYFTTKEMQNITGAAPANQTVYFFDGNLNNDVSVAPLNGVSGAYGVIYWQPNNAGAPNLRRNCQPTVLLFLPQ